MSVEELRNHGMDVMDETAIASFLSSRDMGILGLPTEDAPHMVPITYGFDGESRLYFNYILGDVSRKKQLSDRAETARFLVYSADTSYTWQSVLLSGPIVERPELEWEDVQETVHTGWRPELFNDAELSGGAAVYEFTIDEQSGIKHVTLPAGFEREHLASMD